MTEVSSSDREVISALFEASDWLDLFDLHLDFVLSPGQVLDSVERLQAGGYLERKGLHARLTDLGREWVIASRRELFMNPARDWRSYEAKDRLVRENEPYLPDFAKVDRKFFVELAKSD